MVSEADLVLVHPPSVYDFRRMEKYFGPVSDVVPSDPVFDMYPAGFLSIASYLGKRGFDVRILNVAALMLLRPSLDVERLIARTYARVYAVDLHWAVHAHGAIEIAKLIKKYHPDCPVVFGGITSTYYFKELLERYGCVDYVLLGDTTEKPFEDLLGVLFRGGDIEEVPNLAYRTRGGVKSTGIKFVPESLDQYCVDYDWLFSRYARRSLLLGSLPCASFLSRPIGAVISFKGCTFNCAICGGSRRAYETFLCRKRLGRKSPEVVVEELRGLLDNLRIPVFFIGDLRLLGDDASRLISLVKEEGVDAELMFEFFTPPPRSFLEELRGVAPRVILQISPETPNEELRMRIGRPYGNSELRRFLKNASSLGFDRVDMYFMIGLAGQKPGEGELIARFADSLIAEAGSKDRVAIFAAPLSPFLDPGSIAFEEAPKSGYTLRARTLEEHRKLLTEPTWWDSLNYETVTMTRREIAAETYRTAIELARVNLKWGAISEEEAEHVAEAAKTALEVVENNAKPPTRGGEEIVRKTYLYPSHSLFLSVRPKLALRLLKGLLS